MAAFTLDAEYNHDLDYDLLMNSSVTLFKRPAVLEETIEWLLAAGYQIVAFDSSGWSTEARMHADFSTKLSFPTYYGRNLDAFDDCLGDLAEHDYGWTPDVTGLVLVFNRYDEFAQRRPVTAQKVLDIVARRSRGAMLLGERLIGLVQSDDGQIEFHRVGATNVEWNPAEWTISGRE